MDEGEIKPRITLIGDACFAEAVEIICGNSAKENL